MTIDFSTGRGTRVVACSSSNAEIHLPRGQTDVSVVWTRDVPEGQLLAAMNHAPRSYGSSRHVPGPNCSGNIIGQQVFGNQTINGGMSFNGMGFTSGGGGPINVNRGYGNTINPMSGDNSTICISNGNNTAVFNNFSGSHIGVQSNFIDQSNVINNWSGGTQFHGSTNRPNTLKIYVPKHHDGTLPIGSLGLYGARASSITFEAPRGTHIGNFQTSTTDGSTTIGPIECGRADIYAGAAVNADGMTVKSARLFSEGGSINASLAGLEDGGSAAAENGSVNLGLYGPVPVSFRGTSECGSVNIDMYTTAAGQFDGKYDAQSETARATVTGRGQDSCSRTSHRSGTVGEGPGQIVASSDCGSAGIHFHSKLSEMRQAYEQEHPETAPSVTETPFSNI